MKFRLRHAASAGIFLLAASLGCGGELEDPTSDREAFGDPAEADREPEEGEAELTRSVSYARIRRGSSVHVCRVNTGLNNRTGPSTRYRVLRVLRPRTTGRVLTYKARWARIRTRAGVGWSHRYYLCSGRAPRSRCRGFIHPAPRHRVTSNFGTCRDRCRRRHTGIDLGLRYSWVRAADGGVVTHAGWGYGYGYYIDINHCGRYTSRYAHLSRLYVRRGWRVSRGARIARSGNTGHSTGPHLHFEIRRGGSRGTALNPRRYIRF